MASKTAEKQTQDKQGAENEQKKPDSRTKVIGGGPAPKVKTPRTTRRTPDLPRPEAPTATTPDDTPVVFAFRLTRAERDEIHAAAGSAKASRFVKAIVLAGARGDMKAVQEVVDEILAARK